MNPLISVIVPVFNVEDYLEQCIKSIINQTYKNLEILLIDDGSSDKSGEICKKFAKNDSRIKLISKENGGQSSARNLGLDLMSGEFLTFVDSDDILHLEFIEKLYEILKKCNLKMAMSGYLEFKNLPDFNSLDSEVKIYSDEEIFGEIFSSNPYFGTAVWRNLYHKSIFENLRFPTGQIYEDVAISFEIFNSAKKIACLNEKLYFYRIREGSTTNSFTQKHLVAIKSVKKFSDLVVTKYPNLKNSATFAMCDSIASISFMILRSNSSEFLYKIKEFRAFLAKNLMIILTHKNHSFIKKLIMLALIISPKFLQFLIKIYRKSR